MSEGTLTMHDQVTARLRSDDVVVVSPRQESNPIAT
jgi:hypothetical protein